MSATPPCQNWIVQNVGGNLFHYSEDSKIFDISRVGDLSVVGVYVADPPTNIKSCTFIKKGITESMVVLLSDMRFMVVTPQPKAN